MDLVIVKGEKDDGGLGIKEEILKDKIRDGEDVVKKGNNVWEKREEMDL